jgi:hypothetical protein
MQLPAVRAEIEHMRRQIHRQRREIRDRQRAGISTVSAKELLARMLTKVDVRAPGYGDRGFPVEVDDLCAARDRLVGEGAENIRAQTKPSMDR